MKKFLLSLAVVATAFAAGAANIVEDFSAANKWEGAPLKADVDKTTTFTSPETNIAYTSFGVYCNSGYLFLNSKNYEFTFDFQLPIDCGSMAILTSSGCSENAKSLINLMAKPAGADEFVLVEEGIAVNKKSTTVTVLIPEAYRAAGTVYRFTRNNGGYNQQIVQITYNEVTTEAALSFAKESLEFATGLKGEQEVTVGGIAENLTGAIALTSSNAAFEVPATCTAAEFAAGITVKYTGSKAGTIEATLTAKSGDLTASIPMSAVTASNAGTEGNPFTVSDVLLLNNANKGPFFVTGKIVGIAQTIKEATDEDPGNPAGYTTEVGETATNIAIAEEGIVVTLAVELPSGATREALNLVDNPDMMGKEILISGNLENYFGRPGVKSTKYYGTTGVEAIAIDANAPAEYFNLQGVRVANPTNGLYIVRQGNKVAKVLVK